MRLNGRNKAYRWSKAELLQLKELRAAGHGASAIGTIMNLPPGVVDYRLRKMEERIGKPENTVKTRPCMSCENDFRSKGIHNRLCDRCKRQTFSPYAL